MTHEEILAMLGDYVDYLIANSSAEAPMWNIEKVRSGKPNKWNYIDGCMITACLSLYKTTGDEKYLNFSKSFIDSFVQEDGSIKTYDPKEYNLDNVNQGMFDAKHITVPWRNLRRSLQCFGQAL